MSTWTQGLNPEQVEAVNHNHGPMLILAGAGSGKTTVLVSRTGRLISEQIAKPHEILVLTFTNKAANELKHRVAAKVGEAGSKVWAGTFHSFGLLMMRRYHKDLGLPKYFGIVDTTDSKAIVKDLLKNVRHYAKAGFDEEKLLKTIQEFRSKNQKKAKTEDEYQEAAEILLPKYEMRLRSLGVVDFEDLLLKPLQLFEQRPDVKEFYQHFFKQIMVDEFQDTNEMQMKMVRALSEKHQNITVVGDDDQSIYGWRGAQVSNILGFPKGFANCRVVKLERNYRSTPEIVQVANEVIKKNEQRHNKVLKAEFLPSSGKKPEVFVYETEDQEIEESVSQIRYFQSEGFKLSDIAILFRSNGQGGMLESALRFHQIPYSLTGGMGFFDRKEIRDVMAYLRMALYPNELSLRRIINTPARGIGDGSIEKLSNYAKAQSMSLYKALHDWQKAGVTANIGGQIDKFLKYIKTLPHLLVEDGSRSAGDQLLHFLNDIGYRHLLYTSFKDRQAGQKRWNMIETFTRILDTYMAKGGRNKKNLKEFMDAMELRDKVDEDEVENKVQLLTLHASKGLEFPVVVLIGLEEDILPHKMLGTDISEERRLFYVGVTRAKQRLVLTRAQFRKRYGRPQASAPSRFLLELPEGLYVEYADGCRPLAEKSRKSMLADLYKKLDSKAESSSGNL